jgi:predicted metal-dependent HD superfamily phosphohydrolase
MDPRRWMNLCSRLGCAEGEQWLPTLEGAYAERHRHYHTAAHIQEALDLLDETAERPEHPDEVEFAIWLHDVVYAPRRADNEERSAALAVRWLRECRIEVEAIDRVCALILATRHTDPPGTNDEALVQDVDLGILGASPERYEEYEEQIRREYRWVPGFLFRQRRREILQSFLDRESIYRTSWFLRRRESAARRNLTWAIERLGMGRG